MSYSARVVHKTPGRLRLQIEGEGKSTHPTPEAMRATMVQLQGYAMSQRVRGNPLTRTIVLEGENDQVLERVLDKAQEQGVIQLRSNPPSTEEPRSISDALGSFREKCDGFLTDVSGGSLDFKSTLAWGLAGLGIKQSLTGKFLPAGMTLLMYAIGMLELDQRDKRRRDSEEA